MLKPAKVVILLLSGLMAVMTACTSEGASSPAPTSRTVYLAAIEPKGSTTVDKEPFPSAELPKSGGYKLVAPDKDGKWEVSTYKWSANAIVVNQGDDVTLELVGINGKEHPSVIEGYDVRFNVVRGQVSKVSFKADKAGIFNIICNAHSPTMTAQLVVLPRS